MTKGSTETYGTGIPKPYFGLETSTNRLTVPSGYSGTMTYDSAGNLTTDTYSAAAVTRAYDAENRMTKETQAGSYDAGTYSYDGDGRRVKRKVGAVETWQVYGLGGELVAEYAENASYSNPQKEYGYRNGQLLITVTAGAGWSTPPVLDDNPLVVGETTVQTRHITQLRVAIDALRVRLGMSGYSWTTSVTTSDYINANPIIEMRTALDQALGAPPSGYTAGLAQGQPILAAHIQELRNRLTPAWGIDIRWLVADQLGTPRMVFDQSGSLSGVSRHDYLPFGEDLFAGTGGRTTSQGYSIGDGARQKFTQKERDIETGLDFFEARYFASTQGRFTSVDPLMASGRLPYPQTWNRYTYALNSPLRFTDPSGMAPGDFYNEDGKRLGTDGKNDKKVYVVTDSAKAKQIQKTDKQGGTTQVSAVSSAVELPGYDVRQAIGAAVDRSNAPSGLDKGGGSHEEGLQWGKNASGQEQIVNAAPGAYSDVTTATRATINTGTAANPAEQGAITTIEGTAHVHPKAEVVTGPPSGVVMGGTTTTRNWVQPPSAVDISNAGNRPGTTNVVVGARDKKVYIYDGSGVRATFPLKQFRSIQ